MGKRKSKALQTKKSKLPKLDKEFECPFCSHPRAVAVKMDRGRNIGTLACRICGTSYEKRINRLDEPIDIFGAWIDACVKANTQAAEQARRKVGSSAEGEVGGFDGDGASSAGLPFRGGLAGARPRAGGSTGEERRRLGIDAQEAARRRSSAVAEASDGDDEEEEDADSDEDLQRTSASVSSRGAASGSGARLKRLRGGRGTDDESSEYEDSATKERFYHRGDSAAPDAMRVLRRLREQQKEEEEEADSGRDGALFEDDE
ncbi:putative transcription elongation factor 1 [Besnoitia besnoiti]|uniref:Putative transcription elongation factor 1 n=1 Tax=Besnoitia besnoiti TaxID=94643 RepID=A0A2A9ME32_BESBE|nr:putative transcription elongation factor 1 [Besnoitia besnoiti]PFH35454.1 putative transcription elongation factor 1 [Besnoitia besnoiti]